MSTHNPYFEQKYEIYQIFISENFHFLVVKFSVYLNRHDFVMYKHLMYRDSFPGIYNGFLMFIFYLFVCCCFIFYFILVSLLNVILTKNL